MGMTMRARRVTDRAESCKRFVPLGLFRRRWSRRRAPAETARLVSILNAHVSTWNMGGENRTHHAIPLVQCLFSFGDAIPGLGASPLVGRDEAGRRPSHSGGRPRWPLATQSISMLDVGVEGLTAMRYPCVGVFSSMLYVTLHLARDSFIERSVGESHGTSLCRGTALLDEVTKPL